MEMNLLEQMDVTVMLWKERTRERYIWCYLVWSLEVWTAGLRISDYKTKENDNSDQNKYITEADWK